MPSPNGNNLSTNVDDYVYAYNEAYGAPPSDAFLEEFNVQGAETQERILDFLAAVIVLEDRSASLISSLPADWIDGR